MPKTPVVERFESHRESLPIYHHKAAVLKLINRSQVCVVTGPAGCGKSTQVRNSHWIFLVVWSNISISWACRFPSTF